jgi:hypothetical protein
MEKHFLYNDIVNPLNIIIASKGINLSNLCLPTTSKKTIRKNWFLS